VAYSRLWGNSLVEQLTDIGCRTVEVPHVLGIPVALTLDADATRIVEWPNLLGVNEVHTRLTSSGGIPCLRKNRPQE